MHLQQIWPFSVTCAKSEGPLKCIALGNPRKLIILALVTGFRKGTICGPPFSPAALSQVPGAMPLGEAGFPCLSLLSVQGACASHHVHETQRGKRVRENKFAVLIVVIVPTLLPKSEADSNRLVADHLEVESHDGVTDSELGGRRRSLVLVMVFHSGWLVSSWCLPKPMQRLECV